MYRHSPSALLGMWPGNHPLGSLDDNKQVIIHWLVKKRCRNFPRVSFSLCYYASKKLQGDIPFKNVKNIRWIDSRGIFKYNGNDGDAANMINEIWSAMVGEYIQNNVRAFKWYKQIKNKNWYEIIIAFLRNVFH